MPVPKESMAAGLEGKRTCITCDHYRPEAGEVYGGVACARAMSNVSAALAIHGICGPERGLWRAKFVMPKGL